MNKSIVVLAAGIGSRYGGLKQMDPMGPSGEFIIDYSLYDAIRAGFTKAVFVIRRDIEDAFRATIGRRIEPRIDTQYVFQELTDLPNGIKPPPERKKPWGTTHAILASHGVVKEPFGVINADDFYGRDSYATLARFLDATASEPTQYAMVGFTLRNTLSDHGTVTRGVCYVDAAGKLTKVVETAGLEHDGKHVRSGEKRFTGDEPASMNMWGFKPSLYPHLEAAFKAFLGTALADPKSECLIPAVVDALVQDRKATVQVLPTTSPWFGVTNPDDKAKVVAAIGGLIAAGEYPKSLWAP